MGAYVCVFCWEGGNFKNFCFINHTKDFDCVGHSNLWEILQEIGVPDHLTCLLETCMRVKKQQLEPVVEQWTGLKLGKEYNKAVCCQPAYLTYIQGLSRRPSGKESLCQCRRHRFDPWVGKIPGEGNGNPLQYSCLGNPIDRGAWQATVHGVTKDLDTTW